FTFPLTVIFAELAFAKASSALARVLTSLARFLCFAIAFLPVGVKIFATLLRSFFACADKSALPRQSVILLLLESMSAVPQPQTPGLSLFGSAGQRSFDSKAPMSQIAVPFKSPSKGRS